MAPFRPVFSSLRLLAWPLAILLAGGAITAAAVVQTARSNARVVQDSSQRAVDQVLVQVDTLLQRYQFGLIAVRGVIAVTGMDRLDRATFVRYSQTRNYGVEFPGARGFGFIRRVTPADLATYLASRRTSGWADFALRQFRPHPGELAIIELIEPADANRAAIGLDIASDPVRLAAATAASADGTATLTAPIALVQDSGKGKQSFLLMLPVYGVPDGGRPRAVVGWTFAPLVIDEVLANLPGALPDGAFALADSAPGGAPVRFYAAGAGAAAYGSVQQARRVLGRQWVARFQPSQAFVDQLRLPAPLHRGLAGAALTLLGAALGAVLAVQRARQRRLHARLVETQTTVQTLNASLARQVTARTAEREAALRENDVLVRTINEQLLYSVTDAKGIILEVNDNFCAAFGYQRDQLIGAHHSLLSSGLHDRAFRAVMRETVEAGRTWHGTVCNRAIDGTEKWFDTVVAPHFSENGMIERYVALHTDVTARRAADTALRHVSALLGNVLRAASETSLIATDVDGLITVFNAGAERMLGYSAAELVGRSTPVPFHDAHEVAARAAELSLQLGEPVAGLRTVIQMAERDGAEAREWTYVRKDGSRFPVLLTVTPIRDDSGAMLGYLGIGVDISARKRDDAILRDSMLRAKQASLAKSQFVANMSHEIRTPMNAMLGMLELTLRTELTVRQRDYVDKARRAGATLLALINDVLDFSRIDAGKLALDQQVFAVDVLLHDLAAVLREAHDNDQVALRFDIAPGIPPRLLGDRPRLGQVLANLAGNALKFTHSGDVVVEMTVLAEGPADIALRCCVVDTGIGIPASQLGMIFDGFTQAEASTARRFGGTGLGLAISARIVALMKGQLQVSSEVGRGSRFWFDITLAKVPGDNDAGLPVRVPVPVPGPAPAPVPVPALPRQPRLTGLRLLVVEDNPLNRQVAFELLVSEGASVDLAEGGQLGVDLATDPARAYDAVIMDVQMPDVDGLEATRRIRAVPACAHLPIMAMTANVAVADRDACLAAGMNSHIGKPFDLDQVVARLRGLVEQAAAADDRSGGLIDLTGALPRFLDDASVYAGFLEKYARESGTLLARLEAEQALGDARAVAATLHALKGMALTMGAARLAQVLAAPPGSCHHHAALRDLTDSSIAAARAALTDMAQS